jgi:hypothetical protein
MIASISWKKYTIQKKSQAQFFWWCVARMNGLWLQNLSGLSAWRLQLTKSLENLTSSSPTKNSWMIFQAYICILKFALLTNYSSRHFWTFHFCQDIHNWGDKKIMTSKAIVHVVCTSDVRIYLNLGFDQFYT